MTPEFAPAAAQKLAAVVVATEAAVLAAGALLYVSLGLVDDASDRTVSVAIGVFAALASVGLAFVARGLWNARRWAVSPAITWQVLQGLVGAVAISEESVGLGFAALALAIAGFGALVVVARSASRR